MRPRIFQRFASALGVAAAWGIGSAAVAQETDFEIGFRPLVLATQGEPANDMLGAGLAGAWRWRDDWYFGVGLDSFTFDYERPHQALEIQQDPDIKTLDGSNSFTRVSGWAERRYTGGEPWSWFWNAGLGVASIDTDVVAGPTISSSSAPWRWTRRSAPARSGRYGAMRGRRRLAGCCAGSISTSCRRRSTCSGAR